MTTATAAYEQAAAKGQKVYSRKKVSGLCEAGVYNHSSCSGTWFGYQSYTVPTQFRCPCKCHAPQATCKRCGASGLAWAETYKFGHLKWTLYQPLAAAVNDTYRMEHRCGVDLNASQNREADIQEMVRAERAWLKTERFVAREDGDTRRSAALIDYGTLLGDLARAGDLGFEETVGRDLDGYEDIQARARALYDAGRRA